MKKQDKMYYDAPSTQVFEIKTEGVVCTSPVRAGVQNYNWNEYQEE